MEVTIRVAFRLIWSYFYLPILGKYVTIFIVDFIFLYGVRCTAVTVWDAQPDK